MMSFICSCRNKTGAELHSSYGTYLPKGIYGAWRRHHHHHGSATPGARPRFRPPRSSEPHDTSPAPTTTGWREDRCPVVSKRPLHSRAATKMSPHIRIGPEPVLAAHVPSPPAAGSHCPDRDDSAPHCGTEFLWSPAGRRVHLRAQPNTHQPPLALQGRSICENNLIPTSRHSLSSQYNTRTIAYISSIMQIVFLPSFSLSLPKQNSLPLLNKTPSHFSPTSSTSRRSAWPLSKPYLLSGSCVDQVVVQRSGSCARGRVRFETRERKEEGQ